MPTKDKTEIKPFASCKDIGEVLKKLDWLLAEGNLPVEDHRLISQALLRVYDFGLAAGIEISKKMIKSVKEKEKE